MNFDSEKIRENFPALSQTYNKKPIIYFDNACMTLKPIQVTDSIIQYYHEFSGCHGRTNHLFGKKTTKHFEESRKKIRKFINATHAEEIIFLRNSTEGLNLLSNTLDLKAGDIIVSSDIEHNSNLMPWQKLEKKIGIKRIIVPTLQDTTFDLDKFKKKMNHNVKLVSVLSTSNLTGVNFPIDEIIKIAHSYGSLVLVDAAQSTLYRHLDVQKLNIDFMVASLHKMWGPTGVGFLYGKRDLLEKMPQFMVGGETVDDTTYNSSTTSKLPDKFEAGLQNYAGVIGAGAAIDYINKIGQKNIHKQINKLNSYATDKLLSLNRVKILGPKDPLKRSAILNIFLENKNVVDVSRIINESENIMTRVGKHCVHSYYNSRKLNDSLRISFSAYNNYEEIDTLYDAFKNILKYF